MKILAIGNSFSADATRYLHDIARADGFPLNVVNLFIGGCPLHVHYKNMNNDEKAYLMEFNGQPTGFYVSIREALQSDLWDYVTMQQASVYSIKYDTYTPYLKALSDYVGLHAPKARQIFHQTWAYENGSERLCTKLGYSTHSEMFADIKKASEKAVKEAGIKNIISSGELIETMVSKGITPIYRDTYHLSLGAGRYTAAALWYTYFTGNKITDNNFCGFDEDVDSETIRRIKNIVDQRGKIYEHKIN